MARDGRKTGGRDFKPGNTYSKGLASRSIGVIRQYNRELVQEIMNNALAMSREELEIKVKDKTLPVLDGMVFKICHLGISTGDQVRMNFLLDRLIGKVREETPNPFADLKSMPTAQLIELAKEAIEIINQHGGFIDATRPKQIEESSREEYQEGRGSGQAEEASSSDRSGDSSQEWGKDPEKAW